MFLPATPRNTMGDTLIRVPGTENQNVGRQPSDSIGSGVVGIQSSGNVA